MKNSSRMEEDKSEQERSSNSNRKGNHILTPYIKKPNKQSLNRAEFSQVALNKSRNTNKKQNNNKKTYKIV